MYVQYHLLNARYTQCLHNALHGGAPQELPGSTVSTLPLTPWAISSTHFIIHSWFLNHLSIYPSIYPSIHVLLLIIYIQFSSIQLLSRVQLFTTPWTPASQASLSITNSQSLLKLMSIEAVMPSNHLILCGPLILPTSIFPSQGPFK